MVVTCYDEWEYEPFFYQGSPRGSDFKLLVTTYGKWLRHFSSIRFCSSPDVLADYLKECRKCTLLRFSFSGLWDAMWENSRKMSRYVASPDEEKQREIMMKMMVRATRALQLRKKRLTLVLNSQNILYTKVINTSSEEAGVNGRAEAGGGTVKLPSFNSPNSELLLFLWSW